MPKSKTKSKSNGSKQAKPATQKKTKQVSAAPATTSALGNLLRGAGTVVGGYLGGPPGAALGREAGSFVSHIFGAGDYKVEQNSILTNNQVPTFSGDTNGIRIRHREFLSDFQGSVNFSNAAYNINPGNLFLFPWLSTLATSFETFMFQGLVFEFKSTSASALNSTNTALGTVVIATSYDTEDADFESKRQAESYQFSTSCKPSESMIHPIECAKGYNVLDHLYLTTVLEKADLPADSDPRFYYPGRVQFMSTGMQAVATIGELWVSYDVTLYKPRLPNPTGIDAVNAHYRGLCNLNAGTVFDTVIARGGSNAPALPVTQRDIVFLREGRYQVDVSIQITGTTFTGAFGAAALNGVTYATISWDASQASRNVIDYGTTTTSAIIHTIIDVPDQNPGTTAIYSLPVPVTAGAVTTQTYDCYIVQLSSGLSSSIVTHGQVKAALDSVLRESSISGAMSVPPSFRKVINSQPAFDPKDEEETASSSSQASDMMVVVPHNIATRLGETSCLSKNVPLLPRGTPR